MLDLDEKKAMYFWKKQFKEAFNGTDFAGRFVVISCFRERVSGVSWDVTHIVPPQYGGTDDEDNLICCNAITAKQKADGHPRFRANGKSFEVVKKGDKHEIIEIYSPELEEEEFLKYCYWDGKYYTNK